MAAIVGVAGLAGTALLLNEGAPFRAAVAFTLTALFVFLISLLAPRLNVTLFADGAPVLVIAQTAALPSTRISIRTPDGEPVAELVRRLGSRFWRNRWHVYSESFPIAEAWETPLGAALVRKVAGKFSRRFECDATFAQGGLDAGRIVRRPDEEGRMDYLELTSDLADHRIAVALATVILGGEP